MVAALLAGKRGSLACEPDTPGPLICRRGIMLLLRPAGVMASWADQSGLAGRGCRTERGHPGEWRRIPSIPAIWYTAGHRSRTLARREATGRPATCSTAWRSWYKSRCEKRMAYRSHDCEGVVAGCGEEPLPNGRGSGTAAGTVGGRGESARRHENRHDKQ